jgi:hypothetical protein
MTMRAVFLFPLLLLLSGCGGPNKLARVSGRVTLNGQPLAKAAVVFQPVATGNSINPGPGSGGITDSNGRYTLTLTGTKRNGAVVGQHKVIITMAQEDDSADDRPKPSKRLPSRYNRATKLEYEVLPGGTDSADFPLTSP